VNVTAEPAIPVFWPLIVTARISGLIVTVAELVAVVPTESVAVTDIVFDPLLL
jgi:hypothetical protein